MAVLERSALADSPLADLHTIASELGIDGFRRLRRDGLIDAILTRQGGEEKAPEEKTTSEAKAPADEAPTAAEKPRRRRGGRGRAKATDEDVARARLGELDDVEDEAEAAERQRGAQRPEGEGGRRRRGGRGAREERRPEPAAAAEAAPERTAEGVVDLLDNGSAFIRLSPPETSDGDVYVSAAQVRRCELVAGDRVAGPVRPPRRSERYPSLVRVETINGVAADQATDAVRFDDLPAAFPSERFAFGDEDPTMQAIEWLTPIGKGSRVTIAGAARAGKTETLRRLAAALSAVDGVECSLVLAGVRPEELVEWAEGPLAPAASLSIAASSDAQSQAVERAIDNGKRVAARGGDAVVLIDTLDGVNPAAARKALAAARNIADGGSLTVIATASAPLGGETTVVTLDAGLAGARRFPALDLLASGTLRPELLVGDAAAEAIALAIAEAAA